MNSAPTQATRHATTSLVAVRVARPARDLDHIRSFYRDIVGLPLLWTFAGHDNYDGAIFGLPDHRAQLEVVHSPHRDIPAPTNEDALVLYHTTTTGADDLIARLRQAGTIEITDDPTVNPYWPRHGARVFVDPEGYRVIVASIAT